MTAIRIHTDDGLYLAADDIGPREGPLVVLLHGGGQTRHSWSATAELLATEGFRVLNYDSRGHGESDWSPDSRYDLDQRAGDLRRVVAEIAPASFAFVGASLGGATAAVAVAQGERPSAMVLVDIAPGANPRGVERIIGFMSANLEGFASVEEAANSVARYYPERDRPKSAEGLRKNLRLNPDGRFYWHWDPAILEPSPRFPDEFREGIRLLGEAITIPVMLVRGRSSDVVDDAAVGQLRELVPRLVVSEIKGAGHMIAGDRNDAFNDAIIPFLHAGLGTE